MTAALPELRAHAGTHGAVAPLTPPPCPLKLMQVSGGRRQVLMTEAAHTVQALAQAPSITPLADPLFVEDFEKLALSESGFASVRPALTPAASGEPFMRAIPFQTISW